MIWYLPHHPKPQKYQIQYSCSLPVQKQRFIVSAKGGEPGNGRLIGWRRCRQQLMRLAFYSQLHGGLVRGWKLAGELLGISKKMFSGVAIDFFSWQNLPRYPGEKTNNYHPASLNFATTIPWQPRSKFIKNPFNHHSSVAYYIVSGRWLGAMAG